jgi:hypothetical protein
LPAIPLHSPSSTRNYCAGGPTSRTPRALRHCGPAHTTSFRRSSSCLWWTNAVAECPTFMLAAKEPSSSGAPCPGPPRLCTA